MTELDWKRDSEYGMSDDACHVGHVQIRNHITSSRARRADQKEGSQ